MKRRSHIKRNTVSHTIDLMMAQTGINREQATIAFNTILRYMKTHSSEPLNKLVGYLFHIHDDQQSPQN